MTDIIQKARTFAINAHNSISQVRKYTNEPYWKHPEAVANIVSTVTTDPVVIASAWLHDVVEDTGITIEKIEKEFGKRIADIVSDLTDVSKSTDGNRKVRKEIDRRHTAQASIEAKTIKLADLIDNTVSIVEHDPEFAEVYLEEKAELLKVLTDVNSTLFKIAVNQVEREK